MIPFTKMQGAANDFVVVDARELERDWPRLAIAVCDRHLGIGADSLVLLVNSSRADFGMLTYDADGSEAETCGNGIRCLARYVLEKGMVDPALDEMTIETVAAINRVSFERKNGKVVRFRVNMGKPRLNPGQIPVDAVPGNGNMAEVNGMINYRVEVEGQSVVLNLVSMGNPHAVHFVSDAVADFPMSKLGPIIERLPVFPKRTNFEVVRVLNDSRLEARVWERGVGETQACGSGACAITVASKLLGYTGTAVDINLPGGTLAADWNGNGEVVLGGPAEVVFEGVWPE